MQSGGGGVGLGGSLIPVILIPLISLVSYGVIIWIFYKFYGALTEIRDELRNIKDALRERRSNL
jgi:hypothetical protein